MDSLASRIADAAGAKSPGAYHDYRVAMDSMVYFETSKRTRWRMMWVEGIVGYLEMMATVEKIGEIV